MYSVTFSLLIYNSLITLKDLACLVLHVWTNFSVLMASNFSLQYEFLVIDNVIIIINLVLISGKHSH